MPNIYGGEIVDVSAFVLDRLPSVARTSGPVFAVIGNGHAAWQMAISNTMSPGDKVLVLECGRFASLWGIAAQASGIDVEVMNSAPGHPVDPAAFEQRLTADVDQQIDAVLMVQADTSSSALNDVAAIRAALDRVGHRALLMVDCIATLGCMRYEMDAWGVDLTVGASQKGLMVPPGLGFVWAGPKALLAYEKATLRNAYFDWASRSGDGPVYTKYSGTPPVTHLYGMAESLKMIEEEG
ncbi:MAG: aminotransferase class V-fold PLP-dependent enzyme, partial [Acidimicrobiales bacterium]|nr:aminotransferase class V-fold PLP-dependent enzyme [Acidimicrobiales bacterium]